jgi:polyphosphate kinase
VSQAPLPTERVRQRRKDARDPLLNRELSWMAFNERVLEEALDRDNPLMERLRFLTIFHTNLDEFFMIRVSGLQEQVESGVDVMSADGLTPRAQLQRISERLRPVLVTAQRCLHEDILPRLAEQGLVLCHYSDLAPAERAVWDRWYEQKVHPVLTPLAVGPAHPFPWISNLSLNLVLSVRAPDGETRMARVKVPPMLPRLVPLSDDGALAPPIRVLPIEELIAANLNTLFPGVQAGDPWAFRVTRDTDVEIKADEADDLLKAVEQEIRKRKFGEAVRLEIQRGMPPGLREALRKGLDLQSSDVYEVDGLIGVPQLAQLVAADLPQLKYPRYVPRVPANAASTDLFKAIRTGDILLHHPYDSFSPVVDFLVQAAVDPKVQAIKITLYRTSGDSPIIQALEQAIEHGKQVAAVVELKARFDEENNITWARRLEEAGVHVVYGVPHLKVHSKLTLVVRSEGNELRRYAHIGTGNYNPQTSRGYTDLGLFTTNPTITADVADVFNELTGFSQPPRSRKLLVAPRHLRQQLVERIRREAEEARANRTAHLIIKVNSVADPDMIRELYAASRAGVKIDLLVRGICCLVPGQKDLSHNITVRSVVGRFLEHSRVYWFHNGGDPEILIGSADLMDRNLRRRIEVLAPIEDPALKTWIRTVLLERYLADVGRTRQMQSDGSWVRLRDGHRGVNPMLDVQQQFIKDRR